MTRYEEHQPLDREKLKKEIRRELAHEQRRKRVTTALVVVMLFFMMLTLPFVVTGVFVAKSGIWQVPVLSRVLYKPVEPSEKVLPLMGSDTTTVLNSVIARAEYDMGFNGLTFYLSEQELTTVLNSSLKQVDDEEAFLPIDSAQVAFGMDTIEMYALTKREDGVKVPILVELKPTVEQGQLKLETTTMIIGSLKLPRFAAQTFVNASFRDLSASLHEAIGSRGDLKQIKVTPERLEILIIANQL